MYEAYTRIFDRCGLKTFPVEADTGIIGGKFSHEFMVPAETGENEVVYCESGNYAANIEKATSQGPLRPTPRSSTGMAPEKFATPGVLTIDALAAQPYNVAAHQQIKTLVYLIEDKPALILLRGDDQLNEAKLASHLQTNQFRPATAEEIFEILGAHPGSLGAVSVAGVSIYADEQLREAAGMVTGANDDGFHYRHVNLDRDIKVGQWHDLRMVMAGELCVATGRALKIQRAIEVGHVFKLGTKYSEKLNASVLNENGERLPCIMGCYGIGLTRTLQAIIEQHQDKDGIIWPLPVAPFQVCLTPLNVAASSPTRVMAEKLYAELIGLGIDVILDDRDERPGVKFKDSELVGFPLRIGIGEKSLAKGEVELKIRGGELMPTKVESSVSKVVEYVKANQGA
jgi:prolyl-tRNA synthetase